jgi:hypothetical protein
VLCHFLQHAQVTMRFGDQSGVERAKRRDVTLGFDEVAVSSFGAHTQAMPSAWRAWQLIGSQGWAVPPIPAMRGGSPSWSHAWDRTRGRDS